MKLYQIWFISLFLVVSCQNVDSPDCGCDSSIEFVIEDNELISGFLFQKDEGYTNPNFPLEYKYSVYYSESYCVNCILKFYVCNDSYIDALEVEIPPYPGVEIQFSGQVKKMCKPPGIQPADITYYRITITKIEQQ